MRLMQPESISDSRARPLGICNGFWAGTALLLLWVLCGCVPFSNKNQTAGFSSLHGYQTNSLHTNPTTVQAEVMRFADEYSVIIAQAAEDFAAEVGTFEARWTAARIKVGQATAAVMNAAGKSPVVNSLDLVVLASTSRMVAEDYLVGEKFGAAALPLLETARRLESNSWSLVRGILTPLQREELQELIQEWRRQNPNQRYVGAVRFREFADTIGRLPARAATKPASIFSLLLLDPMAGLDPTVRAVEETRYLAERTAFYAQRMPILLSWQTEFLSLQLANQPAPQQVLSNAAQVSASMEIFARTAEQLPQVLDQQREAAINQFYAGLATERSNLLASLVAEDVRIRALLAETRGTLDAAGEAAGELHAAVETMDQLVRYVVPPRANAISNAADGTKRGFNVLDYGTVAGQVGAAARDIHSLLEAANRSTPQFAEMGRGAADNLDSVLYLAFGLGVALIVIFFGAALLYKFLAQRFGGSVTSTPHELHKP